MARTEHQKKLLAAYRERPITGAVCAVTDTVSGRTLLLASPNPAGQRNRFQFAVSTDMPLHPAMAADWRAHGGAAFVFTQLDPGGEARPDRPAGPGGAGAAAGHLAGTAGGGGQRILPLSRTSRKPEGRPHMRAALRSFCCFYRMA